MRYIHQDEAHDSGNDDAFKLVFAISDEPRRAEDLQCTDEKDSAKLCLAFFGHLKV